MRFRTGTLKKLAIVFTATTALTACDNKPVNNTIAVIDGIFNEFKAFKRAINEAFQDEYIVNEYPNKTDKDIEAMGVYGEAAEKYIRNFTNGGGELSEVIFSVTENSLISTPDLTSSSTTNNDIARILHYHPSTDKVEEMSKQIALLRLAAEEFEKAENRPEDYNYAHENKIYWLAQQVAKADNYVAAPELNPEQTIERSMPAKGTFASLEDGPPQG